MSKIPLVLIGGGGHCMACIDVIEQEGKYVVEGILDREKMVGSKILGYPIIGTDEEIGNLIALNKFFLITVGQIKSNAVRSKIFRNLLDQHANLATVISPHAYVSKHSSIGAGTIVLHGATINAGVSVGSNNIINTNCTIEHAASIGNHCHISVQAVVNGDCSIGDDVFIGSGAIISSQVTVGRKIIIGAGSVIIRNIDQPGTYVGNPGKLI